jgi:hypothetical protein
MLVPYMSLALFMKGFLLADEQTLTIELEIP